MLRLLSRRPFLFVLGILAVSGCARSGVPPMADAELARSALQTALEAWQKGESPESLSSRTPPIYFNDQKFVSEVKLTRFAIDESFDMHGTSARMSAQLSMVLKDGTVKDRKTTYLIDTTPAIVIVPE